MPKRIVVADDEPHIRRVVELKLKGAGYEVTPVASGAAGLEAAMKVLPQLIVSDYRMPGEMNGVDLIKAVRDTPGISDTPIILLTGSVAVVQKLKGALSGVSKVTYLSKPFSPRGLLRQVTEILDET